MVGWLGTHALGVSKTDTMGGSPHEARLLIQRVPCNGLARGTEEDQLQLSKEKERDIRGLYTKEEERWREERGD